MVASSSGEKSASGASSAAALDAKLMVATSHGDCKQLKDQLNKKDSSAMVVAVTTSSDPDPPPVIINPLLLASAFSTSPDGLRLLLRDDDDQSVAADGGQLPFAMESHRFRQLLVAYASRSLEAEHASDDNGDDDLEASLHSRHLPPPSSEALLKRATFHGDTALHALVGSRRPDDDDDGDFLACAKMICSNAASRRHGLDLLFKQNNNGDTPLHCAARAGRTQMVSDLVALARSGNNSSTWRVKQLLETENKLKETALHEAIRAGKKDVVELLMEEDPELAGVPVEGTSPLFLAILLGENDIVETLYAKSGKKLSYSGKNGQNALHAAVLRGTGPTKKLLEWNKNNNQLTKKWNRDLTTERDENGSTPLHFAAATFSAVWETHLGLQNKLFAAKAQPLLRRNTVCWHVLRANPAALYDEDNDGLFPIHVAASVGAVGSIAIFLDESPGCAGLRDAKGRTFLHVAVEKGRVHVVIYACGNGSLSWILNMQDGDGNTALHLAVRAGSLRMFSVLFRNRHVHLNLMNNQGQTPRDISQNKMPRGLYFDQNSESKIHNALALAGARNGCYRRDHFQERYALQTQQDEGAELDKVRDSTQTLAIGSVLIATVTFGATFALPGGYKADDHTNGGTPTLAGRYAFDAFMMANTFAFIFAGIATVGLMYSGSPLFSTKSRKVYLVTAFYCMETSVTCLITTFAVGVYMVLAPVDRKTAIAICVLSPIVVQFKNLELWLKWALLASPLYARMGLLWLLRNFISILVKVLLRDGWTLIFIFSWAAYARS